MEKGIRPDRIDIFNNWNEWLNRLFFTTNLPLKDGWTFDERIRFLKIQ